MPAIAGLTLLESALAIITVPAAVLFLVSARLWPKELLIGTTMSAFVTFLPVVAILGVMVLSTIGRLTMS